MRNDKYIYHPSEWIIYKDVENNNFTPLVDKIINLDKSCLITGPAGTGKSELIRQIKSQLEQKEITFKTVAPTNLAALNIGGTTIHKFVSKIKKMESIYNLTEKFLFIDEISMVPEIFYKFFIMLKRIKPDLKFIIAGDFNKLTPINDRININNEFNYANSQALFELCDFNKLELTKCRRSDDVLFNMCRFDNIMNINKNVFKSKLTLKNIAYTNKKRIEINKICMNNEKTKYHKKKIIIGKNKFDPNSQEITVFPNLPIISKINDKKIDIVNNEQFIVEKISKLGTIIVKNELKTIELNEKDFAHIFYPAYCITIYASQGQTFKEPYTIHQFDRLDKRLRYVALTRSSNIDFINII